MKGRLELNLDPASISFEPENDKTCTRFTRLCSASELRELLLDLHVISMFDHFPKEECIVRVSGDFPNDILGKYGLLRKRTIEMQIDLVAS